LFKIFENLVPVVRCTGIGIFRK